MSKVRSLGRVWIVIVATVLACVLAMAAAPAYAAEDAGTTDTTVSDGAVTTDPDDGEDVTGPGDVTPGDADDSGDADEPTNPDTPATPDEGDDGDQADKPAGDTPDDQDKPDQDTPDDPADEPDEPAEPEPSYEDSHANMYRLYNPNSGEHFYTMSLHEATSVASAGWQWEGIGWVAPLSGAPVYRLYNAYAGDHHYTTSAVERDHLIGVGWNDEGIGWYSDGEDHTPVLRQYNPNAIAGAHNFTTSAVENDHLVGVGWNHEGLAWYATNGPNLEIQGQWLVTGAWGSLERYWIGADGNIARGRLIDPEEGTGYHAYATVDGAIVRGKWDDGAGHVYVADQEGRLASTDSGETGWLVTDRYDGQLERYYYLADLHAMRSGLFELDGNQYFGRGGSGCIARNTIFTVDGTTYSADNDGVLTVTLSEHDITLARAAQELSACTNPSMSADEKLRAAFNHIRDDFGEYNPRIPHMKELGWETIYANDMFVGRGGNCFSYGAALAFMAKAIGFANVYACNSGGHGWAEVDGRVYDPEWERSNRGNSYYGVDYATSSSPNYKVVLGGADWMRVAI